eukprot:365069-Chlamydomonas_euryale.AAC.1
MWGPTFGARTARVHIARAANAPPTITAQEGEPVWQLCRSPTGERLGQAPPASASTRRKRIAAIATASATASSVSPVSAPLWGGRTAGGAAALEA